MPLLIPRCRATPLHRCSIQSRSNVMLLLFPSLHLRCPASPLLCSAYHCLTELSMPKHHRTLICRCYTNFSNAFNCVTSLCLCNDLTHETFPLPHRSKPHRNCDSLLRCSGCLLLNNAMQCVAGTTPSNAIALLHKAFAQLYGAVTFTLNSSPQSFRAHLTCAIVQVSVCSFIMR